MARVCVVGSVNMDSVYTVGELPGPGETVPASSCMIGPGGKGGNQAVAAARAGAEVQLVAAVGNDPHAAALRAHLAANGVGIDGVVSLPVPSGTAAVIVGQNTGENMIVVAPGANAHLTMDSANVREAVAAAEVLLLQLEIPLPTALAAARVARAAGTTVVLNASPATGADLGELAAVCDVVVVNEAEAAHWRWPVPHLVTTCGARGATWSGPDGAVEIPAPAVEPVDTTGAGDVFAGVLAAGWTHDHRHALRRAVTAGALATLISGAGDCAPIDEAIEDALV